MIYLQLFLSFLKVGAFSFGGGLGMISLLQDEVLTNGWLTEEELMNFIAVSESTPGPIAVNVATFVGSSQAGLFGAFASTLGVVLPSFLIILLIASLVKNLLKLPPVKAALGGIRPSVVALVLATALTMLLNCLLSVKTVESVPSFDWRAFVILALLTIFSFLYKKIRKKSLPPIFIILLSAGLGILFYAL